jgi:hypothetical protein
MEEDNPQLKTLRDEYKRLGFSVLKDEANKFLPSAAFTDYQAKQDAAKARMKAIEKEIADIESPYEQLIKELNEGVDKQRASLKEQIEKLTADMEHPPKLNLAVKPQGYKSILGLENEGGSMVKIGGLLGTDSAYRMERLAQRQVDLLQGIKNILEKGQTVQEGETDMSYNDSY